MKNRTKALLASGGVLAIAATSVIGMGAVSAQSSSSGKDTLVTKIAQKFGLKEADVKAVFDENRTANEAEREAKMKARLDQAVKDGKITQAQADQIVAKHQEMKTFRDSLEGKTEDERRTAMKAKMVELKQWATDNDIPKGYMMMGHGRDHRHGQMGPRLDDLAPDSDNSTN